MPLQQLIVLAIVAMAGLATLRLTRVNLGRTPLPEGRGRRLYLFAFVVVPPIMLGVLTQWGAASGLLGGVALVPLYTIMLAGLAILMWIAARVVRLVLPARSRRLLLLALVGSEGSPDDILVDPPVTAKLAESLALVHGTNAVFPRGLEFPAQINRQGFRVDWETLDSATRTLEGQIADDHRLGLGVASAATATASDARSRLDTLHRLAADQGQAWAAG